MISFILSTLSRLLLMLLLGRLPGSRKPTLEILVKWRLCEHFHFSISYQRRARIQSSFVHSSKGFDTANLLRRPYPSGESLIQVITFLTTSMSILLPIILQPNWAYFYAAMAVVAGYLFYIPFFHYNISFPGTGYNCGNRRLSNRRSRD